MTTPSRPSRTAALLASIVVALLGVTAYAASVGIGDAADPVAEQAVRVAPPEPAVVIGDSAIAALRWVPNAEFAIVGFEHTLDLESCRRLYYASCRGREGRTPPSVHAALLDHSDNYHTLVVATGYNDGTFGFEASFRNIVSRARSLGYERIVWYTLRSDVDYVSPGSVGNHETFADNNAELRRLIASGDFPDVVIADWGGYTADKREWFTTDGVHYRAVGAWAAADYLTRKMAFLDERPCPFPTAPNRLVENPCPDPDETGPVADVEALYPVGVDGLLCYEIGEQRRFECRTDYHVLQLTRELEPGMSGSDVGALQTRLQRLDLFAGAVDNVYGDTTTDAVSAFQDDNDLPVTGIADIDTLDALGFDVSAL
ncbi:MAG: peptidoglycan-binding protein [Ilumatobacter fluminis]|uniref:peptidoglycan-binding protein n=1 Tax=Ilumatobacter fluminis TaxID=467091 RepID=UPI0032ECFFDE